VKVTTRWTEFLSDAAPSTHGVQIYSALDDLADSVAAFVAAGIEHREPALLVATADHLAAFAERLSDRGLDVEQLERDGLLRTEDADWVLTSVLDGGRPSAAAFERVVGGLLEDLSAGGSVRVFGEMVDLLVARGQTAAALVLEDLWNRLARTRRFSLLCGYRLDLFDRRTQREVLPGVCRAHSHVLPAADAARLAVAVDSALEDVLGASEAGKLYVVASEELRGERVPPSQGVLMWVSAHMPALADRILAAARRRYLAAA
jgi:MEDS: MEthanogen/methylotroph, DcmR Sensory domain